MRDRLIKFFFFALLILFLLITYYQYKEIVNLKTQLGNSYMTTHTYAYNAIDMLDSSIKESNDISRNINFEEYSYKFNVIPILVRLNYEHSSGILDYYFEEITRKCIELSTAIENKETEKFQKLENELMKELEKGRKILQIIRENGGKLSGTMTYKDSIKWYDNISENRYDILKQIQNLE